MSRHEVPPELMRLTFEEEMATVARTFNILTRRARSERATGCYVAREVLETAARLLEGARHRLANEDAA